MMNWKKNLLHGIIAGILATLAGVSYAAIYKNALEVDFNSIINSKTIAGASILGCLLMSVSYGLLQKWNKEKLLGTLNVVIAILSFASIISPVSATLPLDIESPELFSGLTVPMHFFPALSFFTIAPFFQRKISVGPGSAVTAPGS